MGIFLGYYAKGRLFFLLQGTVGLFMWITPFWNYSHVGGYYPCFSLKMRALVLFKYIAGLLMWTTTFWNCFQLYGYYFDFSLKMRAFLLLQGTLGVIRCITVWEYSHVYGYSPCSLSKIGTFPLIQGIVRLFMCLQRLGAVPMLVGVTFVSPNICDLFCYYRVPWDCLSGLRRFVSIPTLRGSGLFTTE